MANIGNVFTVCDDIGRWHSARIVNAGYDGDFFVEVRNFFGISDPSMINGGRFFINPPAFTGTGVGYIHLDETDPAFWAGYVIPRLVDEDGDMPYAVQLNPNSTSDFGFKLDRRDWLLNVDYTAPDASSPFLAWYDYERHVMIPSYHRPSLIASGMDENALRKVVMRPLPFDHPEFDGSNPPLATLDLSQLKTRLANLQGDFLDVDTDGDGIKDAVWVDVGLPVRTDLNGRTYKPLVAIKCIDLDGRLNLNAHGNLEQMPNSFSGDSLGYGFGPAGVNLARGIDSFTNGRFTPDGLSYDLMPVLLAGRVGFPGRYWGQSEIDYAVPRHYFGMSGSIIAQFAGLTDTNPLYNAFGSLPDYWDQGVLAFDPLGNRFNSFSWDTSWGNYTPYLLTNGATRSDWTLPTVATAIESSTNPYLFDPNRRTPYDQPFTLPELEAVLRQNDIDKDVLPGRLREMFNIFDNYPSTIQKPEVLKVAAYNVTTMSNDVPVPGPALADQGYASLYELIYSCAVKSGAANPDVVTLQLIEYLPDEIKQGGKINLNKLVEDPTMFLALPMRSDYSSDSAYLVAYNEATLANESALYERMKMARGIYIILMALSYDKLYGVPDLDPASPNDYIVEPYIEPSFLQADKIDGLYKNFTTGEDKLGNPLSQTVIDQSRVDCFRVCRELAATRLAQWAVNVVDFTDVDAIMTPFIFDVNPFDGNGWGARHPSTGIDPNTGTDPSLSIWNEFDRVGSHVNYRLIWGMERPDLLLTETLAFHNRNVADTNLGGKALQEKDAEYFDIGLDGIKLKDTAPPHIVTKYDNKDADTDYDQIRMPQGSAFMELYCAADPNRPYFPQELYTGNLLDVGRVNDANSPVWRVVVGGSNYRRGTSPATGIDAPSETDSHAEYNIVNRLHYYGPLFSFDLEKPDLLGKVTATELGLNQPVMQQPDRIVWFTARKPKADGLTAYQPSEPVVGIVPENIYYNRSGEGGLAPNEYLVVGPRMETHLTSKRYGVGNTFGDVTDCPKIVLDNLVDPDAGIGTPKYMVAAADASGIWGGAANLRDTLWLGKDNESRNDNFTGLGFSISEPFRSNYYSQPLLTVANSKRNGIHDAYIQLSPIPTTGTEPPLEEPVRNDSNSTKPLYRDGLVGSGTAPYYKSAFLQRLADPLRPWHEVNNPYITVDWNMFDLKVYSGELADNSDDESNNYYSPPLLFGNKIFSSCQWGVGGHWEWDDKNANGMIEEDELKVVGGIRLCAKRYLERPNPWDRMVYDLSINGETGVKLSDTSSNMFDYFGMIDAIDLSTLAGTLLQLPYQPPYQVPPVIAGAKTLAFDQFPVHSLGRFGTDPKLMHPQLGPLTTYPELMHPKLGLITNPTFFPMSQTQPLHLDLVSQYSYIKTSSTYLGSPVLAIPDVNLPETWLITGVPSFQHLPWHNGPMANSYEVMQVPASSPGRFGVEFVDRKDTTGVANTNYLLEADVIAAFDPVNGDRIENLPGSLGSNVRFGHLLNFQHAHGSWWEQWFADHVDDSLAPPFVSLDLANFLNFVNVPSRFVGTRDWYYDGNKYYSYSRFREPGKVNLNTLTASGFAALMENRTYNGNIVSDNPRGSYEQFDWSRGNDGDNSFAAPYRGSSSSLLTVDPTYKSSANATLLRDNFNNIQGEPAFAPAMTVAANTNSYTAFEGIQRLSDMTTTRSNVFAVWLTLGYFEVEKIPTTATFSPTPGISYDFTSQADRDRFNAIYPDGYMLKKEVGLETGEIKRHRAFYIIDRSIPFGYRRGQKLSSKDAILLKRFIE
ncbi:MAG: hypothetical protein FWD31_02675 [Planctomycetaceae bacterium]|nr:hypothetical protein [Planctomycetaceae bacterium]